MDLLAVPTSQSARLLRLEHSVVASLLHHLGNVMLLQVQCDESILYQVIHALKFLIS